MLTQKHSKKYRALHLFIVKFGMMFFGIIGISTLTLLWLFSGSKTSRPIRKAHDDFPPLTPQFKATSTPEVWQSLPMDNVEYWKAVELHERDPAHNPFPSSPPEPKS